MGAFTYLLTLPTKEQLEPSVAEERGRRSGLTARGRMIPVNPSAGMLDLWRTRCTAGVCTWVLSVRDLLHARRSPAQRIPTSGVSETRRIRCKFKACNQLQNAWKLLVYGFPRKSRTNPNQNHSQDVVIRGSASTNGVGYHKNGKAGGPSSRHPRLYANDLRMIQYYS